MFIAHRKSRLEQLQSSECDKSPIFATINTFKELMDYLNHAPESEHTETLLADFSARVGTFQNEGVGLGPVKDHYKMIEAMLLLRPAIAEQRVGGSSCVIRRTSFAPSCFCHRAPKVKGLA